MTIKWERDTSCGMPEDPGIFDTGNGAIRTYETEVGSRLGIKRVTTRSYCGRDNDRYYTVPGDERTYRTYQAALSAATGIGPTPRGPRRGYYDTRF